MNFIIRLFAAILLIMIADISASAQSLSENDRLRMENISLRQLNDSLQRELLFYRRTYVPELWAGLTGLDADEDISTDYSGFGLKATSFESGIQKEIKSAVPSFHLAYNSIYESFVEKYTFVRRKSMPFILGRYNMYLPMFRLTFEKYGVPEELTALCIVESAVSREALSSAGALGMWQLMPETARQYGLIVDNILDERLIVEKATDVAARILRDLRRSLGSWELAVLAYNCGSANVRKAIIKSGGSKNVWDIYDWLPAETRAYLPSLVAAAYTVKYCSNYSIEARKYSMPRYETYTLRKSCIIEDVAAALAMKAEDLRAINCQYIQGLFPGPGTKISVPPGMGKILEVSGF